MARTKKTEAAVPEEIVSAAEKSVEKEESSAETTKAPAKRTRKACAPKAAKTEEKAPKAEKAPAKRTKKAAEPTLYEKIVAAVKEKAAKAKAEKEFAADITVYGAAEGKFYVKSAEGAIAVEPFDYKDADIFVDADYDALTDIVAGKLTLSDAVEKGKVEMKGSASVMIAFRNIIA